MYLLTPIDTLEAVHWINKAREAFDIPWGQDELVKSLADHLKATSQAIKTIKADGDASRLRLHVRVEHPHSDDVRPDTLRAGDCFTIGYEYYDESYRVDLRALRDFQLHDIAARVIDTLLDDVKAPSPGRYANALQAALIDEKWAEAEYVAEFMHWADQDGALVFSVTDPNNLIMVRNAASLRKTFDEVYLGDDK